MQIVGKGSFLETNGARKTKMSNEGETKFTWKMAAVYVDG